MAQFPTPVRGDLLNLLNQVRFFPEAEVKSALVQLNEEVLARLEADGIGVEQVIYVSVDKAGSSSPVMLNMLRDAANLERRGARFVDSKDERGINEITNQLGTGAIVYVDDFAGTGRQFVRNHSRTSEYVIGTFSEFFLSVVMCEEAVEKVEAAGVTPVTSLVHYKAERPLHAECSTLETSVKERIVDLCRTIHPHEGLGFKRMATMVVLYRNAPNTTPLLFRGSLRQVPYCGILPRSDDLFY
ncbi:MAG: hypothetical protein H0X65_11910 [Gemmatimonadetes bacterium]|nr:hypothetical protein [Gemmatimonadota bacterium]